MIRISDLMEFKANVFKGNVFEIKNCTLFKSVPWWAHEGNNCHLFRLIVGCNRSILSSALVAEQVPKGKLVSGLDLVTKENMPQQAFTPSQS